MGFFTQIKEKLVGKSTKQNEKYVVGLDKSSETFSDRINELAARFREINDEYFEELENILIMADVGVSMVMKIVSEIKTEVRIRNITDPREINDIIVDKMFVIYANESVMSTKINYAAEGLTVILMVGVNGAGKTTLMRVLTTVLKQTEGMVSLDGILYNEGNYEKIQKKIGYLPQEIDLYPNLTVKECLVYMGGLSGVSRNDLEQRITYYLEKTSLTEHQNKKMRQLSGGMKRRVGLIQALLNNPDFLIIDEPTTGLDPEERIRIRNLLVDFSKDRTVLFSTHVVEDLAATCTQLAIMKKGSFLYSGSVSGLLENAKGCVWNCTVQNAEEARLLEANYSISSKQYVENGIHMKILSKGKPNEKCVPDNDITLEDAYIYLTNS